MACVREVRETFSFVAPIYRAGRVSGGEIFTREEESCGETYPLVVMTVAKS